MDNYQPLRRDTLSDAVSCRIQFVTPEYFDVYRIGSAISGNPEELKEGIGGMKVIITRDAAERLFPFSVPQSIFPYIGKRDNILKIEVTDLHLITLLLHKCIGKVPVGFRFNPHRDFHPG